MSAKPERTHLWIVLTVPILALLVGLSASNTLAKPSPLASKPNVRPALPASLVISQVYGGGGNTGAPWQNDFIELFNPTAAPITMNGWSVQYASASGAFTPTQLTVLNGTIPPGSYYLIQEAPGNGCGGSPCGAPLPTSEATGTINLASNSGKVALVSSNSPLPCGPAGNRCAPPSPGYPEIIDYVGYGTTGPIASDWEGSGPAPTLNNTVSDARQNGGCTDTDNNAADFVNTTSIVPHNRTSPPNNCFGPTTNTPTNSPTNTPTNSPINSPTNTPTLAITATPTPCYVYLFAPTGGATIVPGANDIGNHTDDGVTNITLPFVYNLYDTLFTSVNVSSNGNLQFISSNNSLTNTCLPAPTFNYAIFPHWDDLRTDNPSGSACSSSYPTGCGVFTTVMGASPNRLFIIEWRAVYFSPNTQSVNFEVLLHENPAPFAEGTFFDVIYSTVSQGGSSATVGVQKDTGSQFLQFECNTAGSLSSGLQLSFSRQRCDVPTSTRTNTPPPSNTLTPSLTPTITLTPPCAQIPVNEGFESGTLNSFTSTVPTCVPGNCGWRVVTDSTHSGVYSAFAPDQSTVSDQLLTLNNAFNIPATSTEASLTFWHRFAFENTYDGGVLEVSTDAGTTWLTNTTFISGGYNGTISTSFGNPLAGRPAWTGTNGTSFTQVTVNLLPYAGQNVRFRFREGTDSSVAATGWWIDDVFVHIGGPCVVATTTPTNTPTNTPIPPTATPTSTPTSTPTNTPVPPPTPCPPVMLSGAISDNDLVMLGRLPDSPPSVCGVTRPTPTPTDTAPRRYDSYRFTNTATDDICVTVSFTATCSTQMRSATYLGAFDPTNISANYMADSGASRTYSFTVPAGQTFVVVLYGADPNTTCPTYTLTVADDGCVIALRNNLSPGQTLGSGSDVIRNNRCDQCDPVNTATGNFWETVGDLSIAGRGAQGGQADPGIPLLFRRTYNSQATDSNGQFINGSLGYGWTHAYNMYLEFQGTNSIRPTPICTAVAVVVGHVTWQGAPAQPNAKQQQPITATIKLNTTGTEYSSQTTDGNGIFSLPVNGAANGTYQWRVKGPKFLANSGAFILSGTAVITVEMGLMRAGDANNDNVVNSLDFTIMKNTFGKSPGDPGYDPRADFNNDNIVNSSDFTLLKNNFGQGGAPPITPSGGGKSAGSNYETFRLSNLPTSKPKDVPTAEAMQIRLAPGSKPPPDLTNTINGAIVHEGNGSTVSFTNTLLLSNSPLTNTASLIFHHDPEIMGEFEAVNPGSPTAYYVFTQTHGLLQYTFNSDGLLTQILDRNHYTATLHYNPSNQWQLDSVTEEPGGRTLIFTYDHSCGLAASGLLTSLKDQFNRAAYFGYGTNGDLTDVFDSGGNLTHYSYYTTTHRLKTISSPNGGMTTNTYDDAGRVLRQDELVSQGVTRTTLFEYVTPTANLASASLTPPSQGITSTTVMTDPLGNVSIFEYQSYQLATLTRNARGPNPSTWKYTYGGGYPLGLALATDPNNNTRSNTWDANGNLLTATDPLGRTTSYAYNNTNDLTTITNALGVTTTYSYDPGGNLLSVTRLLTQTSQLAITRYAYGSAHPGDVLTMTDPLSNAYKYTYDPGFGYKLSSANPLTETTRYAYDNIGHLLSVTSPRNFTSTLAYNAYGDPVRVTDTLGYTTTYGYDSKRNLTSVKDANGHTTVYSYDLASERTRLTRPDGTHSDYGYDLNGNLITQTNALTQTTLYTYDAQNRLTSARDPLVRAKSYGYDPAGNLTVITDALGLTTTLGYDIANQMTGVNYHDGGLTPNVTLGYNALGLRAAMTDTTGLATAYAYDSLNRLTASDVQFQVGTSKSVRYGYDLADDMTSLAYPDLGGSPALTVTQVYSPGNRLASVSDWLSNTTRFAYDTNGNLTNVNYPNGAQARHTYDAADQALGITDTITATTFLSLTYTRSPIGDLASADEAGPGRSNYTYDPLDRLITDRLTGGSPLTRTWGYDGAYEITDTRVEPGTGALITTTRQYDPANELASLLENTGGSPSKQTAFTYDLNGNRKTQLDTLHLPQINYTYDQANRLTNYARGITQASYGYNGDGLRMKKLPQGGSPEYFTWNLAGGLPMLLQDGSASYIYGPTGSILEQIPNGGTQAYYYHTDQLGSVRALTDQLGNRPATYSYDAYGVPLSATGTLTNPFRYAGEYTDAESGLLYLRARYYDPATQQFLTRDPIVAQTEQAYAYVGDNPLNRKDPLGLWADWDWTEITTTNPNTKNAVKLIVLRDGTTIDYIRKSNSLLVAVTNPKGEGKAKVISFAGKGNKSIDKEVQEFVEGELERIGAPLKRGPCPQQPQSQGGPESNASPEQGAAQAEGGMALSAANMLGD